MLTPENNDRYISILADGKFHEAVSAGTEGAVLREYETSDGKKGEKHELIYQKLEATITDIAFHDGDYGKNIQVTFEEDGNKVILSQGTATNFGEDFMKKLPNVDLSEKVTVIPYAFEDDKGKPKRGVNLFQGGKKLTNYFYKASEVEGEKGETVNGYPQPEGDTKSFTKDDWKIHFLLARKFLVGFIEDNIIAKKFPKDADPFAPAPEPPATNPEDDDLDPSLIPF